MQLYSRHCHSLIRCRLGHLKVLEDEIRDVMGDQNLQLSAGMISDQQRYDLVLKVHEEKQREERMGLLRYQARLLTVKNLMDRCPLKSLGLIGADEKLD